MTELDVIRKWREVTANHAKMKNTCWQMLTHPDATPEQLAQVRRVAVEVSASTEHVRRQLHDYAEKKRYRYLETVTRDPL